MSKTSILAILASVGVIFTGQVTADTVAFAKAVQSGDELVLMRFAKQYPDSAHRDDALRLAQNCIVNWVNGGCGLLDPTGSGANPLNDGSGGTLAGSGEAGSGGDPYGSPE